MMYLTPTAMRPRFLIFACLASVFLLGCSGDPQADSSSADSAAGSSLDSPEKYISAPANANYSERAASDMHQVPVVNGPIARPHTEYGPTPRAAVHASSAIDRVRSEPSEASANDSHSSAFPSARRKPTATQRKSTATVLGKTVEVFFATDRLPTEQLIPSMVRTFLPAFSVLLICCALFMGLTLARRFQVFWVLGGGLSVCLGIMVLHVCMIRWQQNSRLASNAATHFSTSRFEATGSEYPLHVGTAEVSVPRIHKKGQFESPSLLRLEFVENPEKHIVLHSLAVDESVDDWFARLSDRAKYAELSEGFIFIHGYNVRFSDALKRTAQLAIDLEIDGPTISYSWPSRGRLAAYSADEATVSWSAPHFERLLIDLHRRTECRTFNIVAHSMGNRVLLESLDLRSPDSDISISPAPKLVETLVMAAPDVDAQQFNSRYAPALRTVANRTTIYFSEQDRALQLSQRVHMAPRLGTHTGSFVDDDRLQAIHIGDQGLFSLGHSYYGSDRVVLADIRRLFKQHSSASERKYLRQVRDDHGHTYWEIDRDLHAVLDRDPPVIHR